MVWGRTGGLCELAAGGSLGAEGVGEVVIVEHLGVHRPALLVLVVDDALGKEQLVAVDAVAGLLVLERGHDLELGAAPRGQRAEDAEHLRAGRERLREEHEHLL